MEQVWRSVRPLIPLIPLGLVTVVALGSQTAAPKWRSTRRGGGRHLLSP
jgi:hypothetical protein